MIPEARSAGGRHPRAPRPWRPWPAAGAVAFAAIAIAACAPRPAGEPGGGGAARPATPPDHSSFHGVIVWLGPATFDTVRVAFDAAWVRTALADDSVWSFSATDHVSGRIVTGRFRQDSLSWSLIQTIGNVTVIEEYAGATDVKGRARGCGGVASRTRIGPPDGGPRAAFALAPRSLPWPEPSDVPAADCRPARP